VLQAAFLADARMEQGKLDDAAVALVRPDSGQPLPDSARPLLFLDSRARLRLLRGDLAGGLDEMLEAGHRFEELGGRNPAFLAWRSHAALALRLLDHHDEARRLAEDELELARTWSAPRALGAALRVAGLVQGGRRGLARLEEAVAVLTGSPAKLEHAKARTELGAALRRANRRSAAREQLRPALELATTCGALPPRGTCRDRASRDRRSSSADLPAQRRVAHAQRAARRGDCGRGPTNREIAQALLVTPKTVEVHLSSVYRKLGIRSRSQLPAAVADRAPAP
jgi:tetratricopeptide (TPR) repeat protein